jgi:hypothetical protein
MRGLVRVRLPVWQPELLKLVNLLLNTNAKQSSYYQQHNVVNLQVRDPIPSTFANEQFIRALVQWFKLLDQLLHLQHGHDFNSCL